MRKVFRTLAMIVFCLLVSGLTLTALAQTKTKAGKKAAKTVKAAPLEAKFLAKGDGIEFCAVSGEKLENKNIKGEFFGREVYFCCNDCLETAQKTPAAYVKKTEAEQLAAVKTMAAKPGESHDHHGAATTTEAAKFLGKGDGVETCPVTGEAISKDVSVEVQGKTVYACCPGCLDKVKNHPELYLKWATKQ